jgi:hypothetical protein
LPTCKTNSDCSKSDCCSNGRCTDNVVCQGFKKDGDICTSGSECESQFFQVQKNQCAK